MFSSLVGCSSNKSVSDVTSSAKETAKSAASEASSAVTSATDAVKGNPEAGKAKVSIDSQDQNVEGTVVCTAMGGNVQIAIGNATTVSAPSSLAGAGPSRSDWASVGGARRIHRKAPWRQSATATRTATPTPSREPRPGWTATRCSP